EEVYTGGGGLYETGHALVVTGYNFPYACVKNSYGKQWGSDGRGKIWLGIAGSNFGVVLNQAYFNSKVKSSPPVQTPPTIHDDPAIVHSHTSQLGLPRSTFPSGLPLYQPQGNLGSWGSSPPPSNANAFATTTVPPGLSMPHPTQQPMQYTGVNASLQMGTSTLSELSPLLPPVTSGALNLTSTLSSVLPSTLAPAHTASLASETAPSVRLNKVPTAAPSSFQGERLVTKETTLNEHNVEMNVAETSLQTGVVLAGIGLDDSERQVPTGPDPLHHNQAPLEP
ncbi:hypothetical protein FRX31_003418, partial [Thalictrum thalictroides]